MWIASLDTLPERGPCNLPLHLEGETEIRGRGVIAQGLPGIEDQRQTKGQKEADKPRALPALCTCEGAETGSASLGRRWR